MKIHQLTDEQISKLESHRNTWIEIGLSLEPCDRQRVENTVDLAYSLAGLEPAKRKIWFDDPLSGALDAIQYFLKEDDIVPVWELVGTKIRDKMEYQLFDSIHGQFVPSVEDLVYTQIHDQIADVINVPIRDPARSLIWTKIEYQLEDQIEEMTSFQLRAKLQKINRSLEKQVIAKIKNQIKEQIWNQLKSLFYQCGYGLHDAAQMGVYAFFINEFDFAFLSQLDGLIGMSQSGWWWPFEDRVILTERSVFGRDSDSLNHQQQ